MSPEGHDGPGDTGPIAAEDVSAGNPIGEGSALEALGAYIRDQRRQSRISMRRLADLAGVSNPYLSQIERGLRKPSADILQQLARALSISAETLYVQAGILEERGPGPDVIGEIQRDHHLTAEHRDALVAVYRAFRAEVGAPIPDRGTGESNSPTER